MLALLALLVLAEARDWVSPEFTWLYSQPLAIPPVKQPKWTFNNTIKYYEMNETTFSHQVYPHLPATQMYGYDAMVPGPTYIEQKGVQSVMRLTNGLSVNTSCHLHGSFTRAPWDGWANDRSMPNQHKDYYYPNGQCARTQWYHDHASSISAENVYRGLAGFHILQDDEEEALNLPGPYGTYDLPLALTSQQYDSNGQLVFAQNETDRIPGDVIHVNGVPWPYLQVEPRKYRLRILNAAITRTFKLYFSRDEVSGENVTFSVIASDSGLFGEPQEETEVYISNGERYEVVVDFSAYKGENVTLMNTPGQIGEDFLHTDKVMRFIVSDSATADPSSLPSTLAHPSFPPPKSSVDRSFVFARTHGLWTINGMWWSDVRARVIANPIRGAVETWDLINESDEIHPVHVHLVDFQVISRNGTQRGVEPYETAGLKDTVWLGPGESVQVRAVFGPWPGVYMFHCHNLVHEDHAMLVAFNVTLLGEYGYHDLTFCDPTEEEWAPRWPESQMGTYAMVEQRIRKMVEKQPYYVYETGTASNSTVGSDPDSESDSDSDWDSDSDSDSDDDHSHSSRYSYDSAKSTIRTRPYTRPHSSA
ncbi:hypothetical protein TD95_004581 [Thielaviopsis punctulata]|uniref:Bilirubin oxidase n=1 Tax=Thielaviopsis punctulata TaxID=72032 RepID=A0A0F4ZJM5_9PEZI|nr:hypothetical protein TD95_004581 [Thielaviopsis punctulata]